VIGGPDKGRPTDVSAVLRVQYAAYATAPPRGVTDRRLQLFQVWWRHFNFFRRYGLEDATTIVLTGILLFVVLFYVYPLKFVVTLVIDQLLGFSAMAGAHTPTLERSQAPRLMQIYGGGVVAVFSVFALMYVNAYRRRATLDLDARQTLDTRINVIDNAGLAGIGVVSIVIATVGGPFAAGMIAGPIYFLIGPFKWALGAYAGRERRRLNTADTSRA
jgi:hypothetical protein